MLSYLTMKIFILFTLICIVLIILTESKTQKNKKYPNKTFRSNLKNKINYYPIKESEDLYNLWKEKENKTNNPATEEKASLPYRSKKVITHTEKILYYRLKQALPEYEVLTQVSLAGFIEIDIEKAGEKYHTNSFAWQNRIGHQRIDFLVCKKENLEAILAIELDDHTHETENAKKMDQKKNESLAAAKIQLIRFHVKEMPTVEKIKETVKSIKNLTNEENICLY